MPKLRRPSPAMVVALVALFSSLTGTAVAAGVPLAKKALFANNAGKLQGKTVAQIAAIAGPAASAAGLVTTKTAADSLAPGQAKEVAVACDNGRAISGGFTSPDAVLAFDTRPTNDTTWGMFLANLSNQNPASVTAYVVCVR